MWRDIKRNDLGPLSNLNESFLAAQLSDSAIFPDLSGSRDLLIASDYSGSHSESHFDVYSFLIVTPSMLTQWEPYRIDVRLRLGLERIMAFKSLNDKRRQAVLKDFLLIAGRLPGLSVSVIVDKKVGTLFDSLGSPEGLEQPVAGWKPGVVERVLRVTHLLGFLIAGLSVPMQDIYWFTDQDDIAPNEARLRDLTSLLANVASHLLRHNLGHLRCGTTGNDSGTKQLEDFVAIPDLVAGALSEVAARGGIPDGSLITPKPSLSSQKTRALMNWFSDPGLHLRRIVMQIQAVEGSRALRTRRLRFHGSCGPVV